MDLLRQLGANLLVKDRSPLDVLARLLEHRDLRREFVFPGDQPLLGCRQFVREQGGAQLMRDEIGLDPLDTFQDRAEGSEPGLHRLTPDLGLVDQLRRLE